MSRYLVDTNLLVYVHDRSDETRRQRARAVIKRVGIAQTAALSAQVLGEFASVGLRKLDPPLPPSILLAQIERLSRWLRVYPITAGVVEEALRGVERHRLGFWDAQLWAVARLYQIPFILSEDTHPGGLDGVRWLDPLAPDFDVRTL